MRSAVKAGRNQLLYELKRDRFLYLLLAPGIVWLIVYKYLPMFGLVIAFKDFNFSKGILGSDWVGLHYFKYIFTQDVDFFNIFRNTLLISLYKLIFSFPVPIILALMLNEIVHLRFKKFLQTSIYLPYFVSWVIFGGIIIQFLSPQYGVVNEIIKLFGGHSVYFLAEPKYFRSIVVITEIWKNSGYATIIYLAAVTGVDPGLYEVCTLEGANRFQKAFYVTLPCIADTIVVMLLLTVGRMMEVSFDQIFVLYTPTTYRVGDVFSTYIYRLGIGQGRFSLTTAIGLFQSAVGLILIVIANFASRRISHRSIW